MQLTYEQLMKRCGTIRVNVAPLLILLGAATAAAEGADVEGIAEALTEGVEQDQAPAEAPAAEAPGCGATHVGGHRGGY